MSAETQETAQMQEIRASQRFCENIHNVVCRNLKYLNLATVNTVSDQVEFDPNVLDLRVKDMILS